MIKRQHAIWLILGVCFLAVAAVLSWLTMRVIQLDRLRQVNLHQTRLARQEAEIQERISTALYRMDLRLIPLIAAEAARPRSFYRPAADHTAAALVTSPLVRLRFEIDQTDRFFSPASVGSGTCSVAEGDIVDWGSRLIVAQDRFSYSEFQRRGPWPDLPTFYSPPVATRAPAPTLVNGAFAVPVVEQAASRVQQVPPAMDEAFSNAQGLSDESLHSQMIGNAKRLNTDFNARLNATLQMTNQLGTPDQELKIDPHRIDEKIVSSPRGDAVPGLMQPVWFDDQLLLVRQVLEKGTILYQCCWLDWQQVQRTLRNEVADLLTDFQFQPLREEDDLSVGLALTALPVRLKVDRGRLRSALPGLVSLQTSGSNVWLSLAVAWIGFLLAIVAVVILLRGVMALSERRANFVSAVSHELRTPLTTLRMYAEMLSEQMVSPEKQKRYADTLWLQTDRLTLLVENVLQFSRLERRPDKQLNQVIDPKQLVTRFQPRFQHRVGLVESLTFGLTGLDDLPKTTINTNPVVIEQILFNLIDNACKYGLPSRTGVVELNLSAAARKIRFAVRDGGPGLSARERRMMFRPFHRADQGDSRNQPGVGLGLSLCQRMAESIGGRLICSTDRQRTEFVLEINARF